MEQRAHEVWAKVVWAAVEVATRGGLPIEQLFEGLPFDAPSLRSRRRVDWSDYCILVERIEVLAGGPEACTRLLELYNHDGYAEVRAVSIIVSPKLLLRVMAVATAVLFPPIEFRIFDEGPDRLRVESHLRAGARPCAAFFRGTIGTLAGATHNLGLPSARVEAELSDQHGIYHLHLPSSRTLLGRDRHASPPPASFAPTLILGVDDDGTPIATTFGATGGAGLRERLAAAITIWDLTHRQSEVLGVLARGKSNKEIAVVLGCAENTVELHVTQLLRRADVSSRSELIARFWSEL